MYRLLSYRTGDGATRAGLLLGDRIHDLENEFKAARLRPGIDTSSLIALFKNWERSKPYFDKIAAEPKTDGVARAAVRLAAPLQYPGVIYMAGANYVAHILEMNPGAPPDKSKTQPFFFIKTTEGTVIGPDETVHLPSYSQKVDWEAEIAFVIGRTARHVAVDDAMDYVAGYTIVNDLSARDNSRRSDVPLTYDWISHKCFDTSCPMGPWIVPADQIADPKNLPIKLWVNDRLEQNSNTNDMFFDYAEQIAWLSERVTLNPGDVVATGTPPGVGMGKGIFLKHGDTVTIEIEGVGRLSNPCVQD
ncbi:MAG: hypothetical protein K0Q70_510 [Rhodospirillales bacterium]|nr:hypothetical protein [Rhodospirillales bacterium]